ncbi:CoA ester lyase [Leptolyngbya sp. 15MV]|nr:CoA ester lyase [Leptolyngbya sp. 15MV]
MFAASSILFVPGSRPVRFAKARSAGAGLVVIDLEDAVPADDKAAAREAALGEVARDPAGLAVRINALATSAGIADLAVLAATDAMPATLLLPMVEHARDCAIVAAVLGPRCPTLVPLIETPLGLRHAREIAAALGVVAVMFGGADFAGELRVRPAWEPLLAARQHLMLACAEARVPAIDVPFIHLDDEAGLTEECARSRALGFAAKAAIHPHQIAAIEAAFMPGAGEIAEAREALAAYEEAGDAAIRHKGRMLEAPIVKHYRAVIARSEGQANA